MKAFRMFRIFLVFAGLVLFVAAGFLAGRLTSRPGLAQVLRPLGLDKEEPPLPDGPRGEVIVLDQGAGPVRVTFSDPDELPDEPETAGGLFVRRQDNSLFLGTGNIEVNVEVIDGEATVSASSDGPEVEVVITGDTVIYEDITEHPIISPEDVEKGEMVVQRQVRQVDSLDGIEENMVVRAWGERRGDRVIAHTIVYDRVGLG
jgi:hypothetical protein